MGLVETAIIAGSLLSGGSSIYGAQKQSKAANRSANAVDAQRQMLQGLITPRLGQTDTTDIQRQILALIGQGSSPQVEMPEFNIPGVTIANNQAYNTGQDALLQFLRSDPASKRTESTQQFSDIAATGNPFDLSDYFAALKPMEDRATQEAIAMIGGQAGSLGQRFGSATLRQTTDAIGQLTEQANLRRQELARGSYESAQGRRLQAAGGLAANEAQAVQNLLQAVAASQAGAGLEAEVGRGNQQAALQEAALRMQGATTQANLGLQARSQQAGLLQQLLGARTAGANADLGLLSLLAGLPVAPVNPGAGMVPGAIAETGSALSMLPILIQLAQGGRG